MKSFWLSLFAAGLLLFASCETDDDAEPLLCMPGCYVVPLQEGALVATPNEQIPGPIGVQVFDGNGQFVPGVAVTFRVTGGGGFVDDTLVHTTDLGIALTRWHAGQGRIHTLAVEVDYSCDERGHFVLSFRAEQDSGDCPEAIDRMGRSYPTVQIGSQCWMARNLRTSTFRDGSPIPRIIDPEEWALTEAPAFTQFDNDKRQPWVYGYLYNWYAVADGRGVCPEGWRIPTTADFDILTETLGGEEVAGGLMKVSGDQFWTHPNTDATNASGFSAVGGSYRHLDGSFYDFGRMATFWTSDTTNAGTAWMRYLYHDQANIETMGNDKHSGLNVRCIAE